MVIPVPPFGSFHTGIPVHWAAAGAATRTALTATIKALRFIASLSKRVMANRTGVR